MVDVIIDIDVMVFFACQHVKNLRTKLDESVMTWNNLIDINHLFSISEDHL